MAPPWKDCNVKALKVNISLLPVKAFYFCVFAAVASLLPYISIYLKHIGLTASETAIIYGTMPFVGFFIRPFIGALADRTHKHKLMMIILSILGAIFHLACLYVPHVEVRPQPPPDVVYFVHGGQSAGMIISGCVVVSKEDVAHFKCHADLNEGALKGHEDFISNLTHCELRCTIEKSANSKFLIFSDGGKNFSGNNFNNTESQVLSTAYSIMEQRNTSLNKSDVIFSNIEAKLSDPEDTNPLQNCMPLIMEQFTYTAKNSSFAVTELNYTCKRFCINDTAYDIQPIEDESHLLTFWLFFTFYFLGQVAFLPLISMCDAIAYSILKGNEGAWGKTRLFGTIGFMIFAVVSGLLMDSFSTHASNINYSYAFYLFVGFLICSAITAGTMHVPEDVISGNMMKNFFQLFRDLEILVFLIVVFLVGMNFGVLTSFLFWLLKELCARQLLLGLALLVTCVIETPVLYFSGKIQNIFGLHGCMCLGIFAYAVRFLSYSFLSNPWFVLPIELTHGVAFAVFFPAITKYASVVAPQGMDATIQGLVSGLHFGMGTGAGSLIGGLMYQTYGGDVMFRIFGIANLVLLLVYGLLERFVIRPRQKKNKKDKKQADSHKNEEEGTAEEMKDILSSKPESNGDVLHNDAETGATVPDSQREEDAVDEEEQDVSYAALLESETEKG